MQAIILAAGRGIRMGELTEKRPKPMLLYKGKNLIEYKLEALPESVTEVIMVVGYLKEAIMEYFGSTYGGRKMTYVNMPDLLGSAYAVKLCEPYITGPFLVLMGDDVYDKKDIEDIVTTKDSWTVTAKQLDVPWRGGIKVSPEGFFTTIDEEVNTNGPTLVNTGLHKLDQRFFQYELVKVPGKEEYGLPHTILAASQEIPAKVFYAREWKQVTSAQDVDPIQYH